MLIDKILKILIITILGGFILMNLLESFVALTYEGYFVQPNLPKYKSYKSMRTKIYSPTIRLKFGKRGCSAVVIDSNYALTAAHCLYKNNERIKVFTNTNDQLRDATVAAYYNRTDLGLIKGNFEECGEALFDNYALRITVNQPHFSCGYAFGNKEVSCNLFFPTEPDGFSIRGSGYLIPGMSGGPVINQEGYLVGLNYYMEGKFAGISSVVGVLGLFGIEK